MRLCSRNAVRHDSAPLWNGRLWERGEAAMKASVLVEAGLVLTVTDVGASLTW